MEEISWTNRMINEGVLHRVEVERNSTYCKTEEG